MIKFTATPGFRTCPVCGNTALVWLKKMLCFPIWDQAAALSPLEAGPARYERSALSSSPEHFLKRLLFLKAPYFER